MKQAWRWITLLALATGGCDPGAIYTPTTGGYMGAKISAKKTWSASGTLSSPQAACDGDLSTVARTDYEYAGAELVIDLKQSCLFQTVIIDHGREQEGYCRKVTVATSMGGRVWQKRHVAPGTRRSTILSLPEVVLARYVRIKAEQPGSQRWAVAEVFLQ